MKVLFVSPYLPSRRSGAPVRLRGLASGVAERHSVSVLSFVPAPITDNTESDLDEVRQYCADVVFVPNDRISLTGGPKRALQLRSLLSTRTYESVVYRQRALQKAFDAMTSRTGFDVVQVEACFMTHLEFPSGAAVVLDEHNIEYEVLKRTASANGAVTRKIYNFIDYVKLRAEEESAWRSVDACALTSPRDEAVVRRTVPSLPTAVVANAVDTHFFSPAANRSDRTTILFFGAISYYPNTDAVLYFLREIFPLVKRSHPNAQLVIVGPAPPPEVRRWAGPNVTVTGAVEDVRTYLERARVVIAPLRIGGGTRLKILEAMATGGPVVSTRLGAEGLGVTDERDILLGDDAVTFATQVRRVLDDDELAARLGAGGRRLVEEHYDWKVSVRALEDLYVRARAGRPLTAASAGAG